MRHFDYTVVRSSYYSIKFAQLPSLCTDAILGQDFLFRRRSAEMQLTDGQWSQRSICLYRPVCEKEQLQAFFKSLSELSNKPPQLRCAYLPKKKKTNKKKTNGLVKGEVQGLLFEHISEPSVSP